MAGDERIALFSVSTFVPQVLIERVPSKAVSSEHLNLQMGTT